MSTGSSHDVNIHSMNNEKFVFLNHGSFSEPTNIYLFPSFPSKWPIINHNQNLLSKVHMSTVAKPFNFISTQGETFWGWHAQLVNGTTSKAPPAFLIRSNSQDSWYDAWSYRWNFQSFSSQGYAIIAITFHGSDSPIRIYRDTKTQ